MGIAGMLAALSGLAMATVEEDVYEKWRDYLAPKPSECAFEESGWRGTFWSAVVEAQKQRKPILLWAMNGHPMACT